MLGSIRYPDRLRILFLLFMMTQPKSDKLPDEDNRAATVGPLLQTINKSIGLLRSLLLNVMVFLATLAFAVSIYDEIVKNPVKIATPSMPSGLEKAGWKGITFARLFGDEIKSIQERADSAHPVSDTEIGDNKNKFVLPGQTFSIESLVLWIRDFFGLEGRHLRITVFEATEHEKALYCDRADLKSTKGLVALLSFDGDRWHVCGPTVGYLAKVAAHRFMERNEPYILAAALREHQRSEAERIVAQILLEGDAKLRPWALNLEAMMIQDKGNTKIALARYQALTKEFPGFAPAHINLGQARFELYEQWSETDSVETRNALLASAFASFKEAARLDQSSALANANMGTILIKQKHWNSARSRFLKAIELDARLAQPHEGLGEISLEENDRKQAIAHYMKSVALNPYNARVHFTIGLLSFREGRFRDAKRHCSRALSLKPKYRRAKACVDNATNKLKSSQGEGSD